MILSCFLPLIRAAGSPHYPTKSFVNKNNIPETLARIAWVGTNAQIDCYSCNIEFLEWTYKPRNEYFKDIAKGLDVIKIQNHAKIDPWGDITVDHVGCKYTLFLIGIRFETAGKISCWNDSLEIIQVNLIVINTSNSCSLSQKPSALGSFLDGQNNWFTIKCFFQYASDESCTAKPIWTDLSGHRDLTTPSDEFQVNMDNEQAWIHFRADDDMKNGTTFNLSISFSCHNISSVHVQYDFGQVSLTITDEDYVGGEVTFSPARISFSDTSPFVLPASITGVSIASIFILALFLFILKKYSKLYFADSSHRRNNGGTVQGSALPEVPMVDGYVQIAELPKDVGGYEVLDDETYDIICDTNDVTTCENYIQVIE